jgi:hypothetical protein
MNKLQNIKITSPEVQIKWLCFDIFISTDSYVFNLSFSPKKEILVWGSYGYIVNGKFRTKKWINNHCVNVLGSIYND